MVLEKKVSSFIYVNVIIIVVVVVVAMYFVEWLWMN